GEIGKFAMMIELVMNDPFRRVLRPLGAGFERSAVTVITVKTATRARAGHRRVGRIVEDVQGVVIGVIVKARLEIGGVAEASIGNGVDRLLVPLRPLPVARRGGRRRRALLAFLADETDGVLVGGVRGVSKFAADFPVRVVGVVPIS